MSEWISVDYLLFWTGAGCWFVFALIGLSMTTLCVADYLHKKYAWMLGFISYWSNRADFKKWQESKK